ncbi:tetratricopeptide repeat protein [Paraburkholderia sp. J12]|uniref:tetratricopeptide repeat protein n=1 Tax=Paraburkholderia sp. J12 TaxID=2805432 RepID=UPI002ABD16C4|nr:tetratricopeptide repeat protein [Paraburkholderia sp. J12]
MPVSARFAKRVGAAAWWAMLAAAALGATDVTAMPSAQAGGLQSGADPRHLPPVPFSDPTSTCSAQWGLGDGSFRSPLSTPGQLRAVCAAEAARGNLDAATIYGQLVLFGVGGPPSGSGFALLSRAAADGQPVAQRLVGQLYLEGQRVPADVPAARMWLGRAADAGDGVAASALGSLDFTGEGAPKDPASAYRLFARAATNGDPHGAANAGRMLLSGAPGVPRDAQGAVAWFIKGTSSGDADCQFLLGLSLLQGAGVARDDKKAFGWLAAAARQGARRRVAQARAGGSCWPPGLGSLRSGGAGCGAARARFPDRSRAGARRFADAEPDGQRSGSRR